MNHDMRRKGFVVSVAAVGLLVGVIAGFFAAHRVMGDMSGMTTGKGGISASSERAGEMGTEGVSAPPGHGENGLSEQAGGGRVKTSGEMGEMKGMPMKQMDMNAMAPAREKSMEGMQGMPGMSATPSGAVVIPAVMRQLIGVRSAPAGVAVLGQEIRAVGTVGYDERGLTQVTVKTSGWM